MTRDEKAILIRAMTGGFGASVLGYGYKKALSRLIARGLIVNERVAAVRGRGRGWNRYRLTEEGRRVAAQVVVKTKRHPMPRATGHMHRNFRRAKLPRFDMYGYLTYE